MKNPLPKLWAWIVAHKKTVAGAVAVGGAAIADGASGWGAVKAILSLVLGG